MFCLFVFSGGYEGDVPPHSLHPHLSPLPSREREEIYGALPQRERKRRRFSLLLFGFLIETFRNDGLEGKIP